MKGVPSFGSAGLELGIEAIGVTSEGIEVFRVTSEESHNIEFVAIAITNVEWQVPGSHQLVNVARQGGLLSGR